MIETTIDAKDDPAFIDIVAVFLRRFAAQTRPDILCITKIDNWFDHKWFHFFHGPWKSKKERLGPPPFAQKRVISQKCFIFEGEEFREHTEDLYPCVPTESTKTAFVWYTGNTKANQSGAVMCYVFLGYEPEDTWYASLVANPDWLVSKVKGARAHEIKRLLVRGNI